MKHSSSVLSVGLIVRSTSIWRWQSLLIDALVDAKLVCVNEVLIQGEEHPVLPKTIARLHKLDSILFKSPMTAYELVELPRTAAPVSKACDGPYTSTNETPIDLWINLSERPVVAGELQKKSSIALLETHFSDSNDSEALSSVNFGYSEFARNEKQCYFSIVAHGADDSTHVLTKSRPSLDAGPLSRNMNQYWRLLESSWVRVCKSLQTKSLAEIVYKNTHTKKSESVAQSGAQPAKAYHNLRNIFLDKFSQKFLRKEQWVLLLQFRDQLSNQEEMPLSFADYVEISPPADCFWADPFVVTDNSRHYVFFEELPYATERGHLSCMEVFSDGGHTEPKIILKKPYHLSYPNVFSYESQYYMIPESGDTGSISLYRSTDFPYQWEHQCTLMEDIHAYDSTLIEHEGLWWLFACIAPEKGMSGNEELHIYYADSPLSQSWEPHPLNPIISDASCARPAGKFFEWEGHIYRPSQDCAGSYGAGLNINQIKNLNKQVYLEELVHCSRPTWDPKLIALHTLNFNQHVSVADAMRVDGRFL